MPVPKQAKLTAPIKPEQVRYIKLGRGGAWESCLERMIFFGEGSLRTEIREFVTHSHGERNHQGLGNRLIMPAERHADERGAIRCRERLGGTLNYYYRAAA